MRIADKKYASVNRDAAETPGSWSDGVECVADLGSGYLLVKVNSSTDDDSLGPARMRARGSAEAGSTRRSTQIPPVQLRRLLRLLTKNLADLPAHDDENAEFMDALRTQEMLNRRRDVAAGLLLSASEMAKRLGVSTQSLSKAVQAKRMFALDGPSGRNVYPAFFADLRCERGHIERVSQALGDLPGPSKWEFFTSPRVSLNNLTPIESLAKGRLDQVMRAAAGFGGR